MLLRFLLLVLFLLGGLITLLKSQYYKPGSLGGGHLPEG